ncbi:hypothetical protein [Nocardia sp. NPDC024068]|uniref:hypothetical protein n=1 Tax=Nocardia sp. NPDC024068 TaxID=3157197 RepID=UPI0033CE3D73
MGDKVEGDRSLGYRLGIGIAIGLAIGIPLGLVVLSNLAVGVGLGIGFGLAFGLAMSPSPAGDYGYRRPRRDEESRHHRTPPHDD